ncbi:RNA polymerase recycling motor HelD [Lapidilactobacillus wuchangensis]|uniref:RNA polymerase recycling motor HelD n=1 Tax=Lapidilactobacillus wuchangensis TaxID=2486001 RepID=UPI000F7B86FB|nr:RNA polymerase recycling motor HelD [Lapidilactobacillus wuchangensis]
MYADLNRSAEEARVKEIAQTIAAEQASNEAKLKSAQHETHQIELNYGDTAKVNTIEVDDRMETNAAIQQQKQLVSLAVENQTILEKRQHRLTRLAKSPYFGRIDIDDGFEKETLYIGTATLMDAQDEDFLIYDWRSPIAGVYYNGTLGPVSYLAPAGRQQVNLQRKRQFTIENDQINNMFDTDETVGDEILQGVLGEAATLYMQNIVATIQREQNEIIRNTSADVLIVQGVAGSGKTSTILQRLAYLLYHSRQKLDAEQVIMFSPNHLFSNYISQVLPSLGEKNMRQVTLSEFFSQRCHNLQVEDKFSRYERDQRQLPAVAQTMRQYLEAGAILKQVDHYLAQSDFTLKFNDLLLNGEMVISQADCQRIYQELPAQMSWADKFQQTKNRLIRHLQRLVRREAKTDWVQDRVDTLSDYEYQTLLDQEHFDNDEAERQFLGKKIAQLHFEPIYDALYNDYFLDIDQQYLDFLEQNAPNNVAANFWQTRLEQVKSQFERHQLALSDCAPYLYLRDQLTGGGQNHQIQYLFIDEMQDYSPAQLAYLHHAFPLAKLTLLGDQAQDLFASSAGLTQFDAAIAALFPHKKVKIYRLNNSYRSTQQITHFASALLPDHQEILAFNRPGPKPQLVVCQRLAELNQQVSQQCERLLAKQTMVAVLTKTEVEAEQIYATLQSDAPVTLMTEKQHHLEPGVMIMPIYLAKGLEFDAVIGYNVSASLFQNTTDAHILYTIASRAMHELVLISLGQPSALITQLDQQLYRLTDSGH